jgi:hypothetical protein
MHFSTYKYGSEVWFREDRKCSEVRIAAVKFGTSVKGCFKSDTFKKEDIWKDLSIYSLNRRIDGQNLLVKNY